MTVLWCWLLPLPGLLWAVIRLGGWERGLLVPLFAFTPYVAVWSWLPVVLAFGTRRWTAGGVALIAALALTAAVLPRALASGDRGPSTGVPLGVMTSNMLYGQADPETIVRLVRKHEVAVLAVQEFTPDGRRALADAGLGDLLPYSSLADEPGSPGSGVYSRFPVTAAGARRNGGGFQQAYATIDVPGAGAVAVESAHPLAPYALNVLGHWHADLRAQPRPAEDGPPSILLGDFNATLDHGPLRALLAAGYRDAAEAAGRGLIPTWPANRRPVPPVTIDHVLVDERIGVRRVSVHRIPKSDHRAVVAQLTVPAADR
ncbi:MAG TPA: endonuclease/exonuclease/phosphatase family protein [Actinoplanes sp.]